MISGMPIDGFGGKTDEEDIGSVPVWNGGHGLCLVADGVRGGLTG